MRLLQKAAGLVAVSSELRDGPMGSSTNPGPKTAKAPEGEFAANRRRFLERIRLSPERLSMLGLVHGGRIARDEELTAGERVPNADAVLMQRRENGDQPIIGVAHADCIAFVAGSPDAAVVGHAGWRGLVNERIVKRSLEVLRKCGVPSEAILIGMFPAIQVCHFEVDPLDEQNGVPLYKSNGYGNFIFWDNKRRYFADLRGIFVAQCREMGVPFDHIQAVWRCTYCESNRLISSRRNRHRGLPNEGQNMMLAVTFV